MFILIARYKFDLKDFQKFIKWDKYKYTRNLVHEGNSKFNLILMCWPEAVSSAIHDHQVRSYVTCHDVTMINDHLLQDSHCFMRILAGEATETRYHWPEEETREDGGLAELERRTLGAGETAYMSDQLGLHRVENESHSERLLSLHLYSPPFADCNVSETVRSHLI